MIHQLVAQQRSFFSAGGTKPYDFRMRMLAQLHDAIQANAAGVLEALRSDLNKPDMEGYMTELGLSLGELAFVSGNLKKWMKPRRVKTPISSFPGRSFILPEPYGVALIMSPWNYPFLLTIEPLIGAIAAGNCAVLKPSAYSPATSSIIRKIINEAFEPAYVAVIEGGRNENQALLQEQFEYIFFTGGTEVGKLVMESAARTLTPITLELGGKSPCIVDETADIPLAARRIAFGKYLNGGQTCVAPDYLLVHERVKEPLVAGIREAVASFFPQGDFSSMAAIINQRHYERLMRLLEPETILLGGWGNPDTRIIAPTLLDDVSWDAPIMQEEIFGPILPILPYARLEDALQRVKERPRPLALYLFTKSRETERRVLNDISFGGGCINDTVMHIATSHMPFGGVGGSGMGGYHGKASFDTFSHQKSVLSRGAWPDPAIRYRPYSAGKDWLLKKIMR